MSRPPKRNHETVLTIDLKALEYNIIYYKSKLNSATKLLAMVKAFGYGIDHTIIGKTLENKIDYFGVAFTDEAVELRESGVKTSILVMNANENSFSNLVNYQLETSIFNLEQLKNLITYLNKQKVKDFPIHLKIDSGMHRLGFSEEEISDVVLLLLKTKTVKVKGIFSHLAAADNKKEDVFTNQQLNYFNKISQQIEAEIGYTAIKHVLNTYGIERFIQHQSDMVRLGLGMYGVSSDVTIKTVASLTTNITQIKKIKSKGSVGYGRSQYVEKDTLLGVIPIGYADGFSRSLSNGVGHVLVNNQLVPVVGRVSMDMTIIDLTTIPNTKLGDKVEIFGKNRAIQSFAKELNTIPYEVLTSISQRVLRKYV